MFRSALGRSFNTDKSSSSLDILPHGHRTRVSPSEKMATNRIDELIVPSTLTKRTAAPKRVICFPWAGGGASFFIRLALKFPKDIEGETFAAYIGSRCLTTAKYPWHSWCGLHGPEAIVVFNCTVSVTGQLFVSFHRPNYL